MPLIVRFLGTSASRPTVERGVSSLAIIREGETLLFDCGEGTQRQLLQSSVGLVDLREIFLTHLFNLEAERRDLDLLSDRAGKAPA